VKWNTLIKQNSTYCKSCADTLPKYTIDELNNIMSSFTNQRLTVVSDMIYRQGTSQNFRKCICICGNTITPKSGDLVSGHTRSCGCIFIDYISRTGADNHNWEGGDIHYYGESWHKQRGLARERDNNTCQRCGETKEKIEQTMDTHHITKFRMFNYIIGENRNDIEANDLSNLVCLCHPCHMTVEANPEAIDDFRNNKGEIEYDR